ALACGLSLLMVDTVLARAERGDTRADYFFEQSKNLTTFDATSCGISCHVPIESNSGSKNLRLTAPSVAHDAQSVPLTLLGITDTQYAWRFLRDGASDPEDLNYKYETKSATADIGNDPTPVIRYCIAEKDDSDNRPKDTRWWNCGSLSINRNDPPNNDPNINNIPNQTLNFEQSKTITVTATDESPNTVTFEVSGNTNPGAVNVTSLGGGDFRLRGTEADSSSRVTITATDNKGATDTEDFLVTVNPEANNPPSINSIADRGLQTGQQQSLTVTVTDEDPASVTYAVTGNTNSDVAKITSDGGNKFTLTAERSGSTNITIRATDNADKTDSDTFTVTVTDAEPENQPPVLTSPGSISLAFAESRKVPIDYTDENPGTVTMSVTSNSNPLVALVVPARTSFQVQALIGGSTQIELTATDEKGLSDSKTFTINVGSQNLPPAITNVSPGNDIDINAGQTLAVQLTVTDENPNSVRYEGVSADGGIATVSHDGGGKFSVTGQSAGSTSLLLSAIDDADQRAETTVNISVQKVDGAPVALDDQFVFNFVSPSQQLDVLANDSDPEGGSLAILLNSSQTALGGSISVAGAQVEYTPPDPFNGQDSFSYQVMDPGGQSSASADVSVLPSDTDGDGVFDGSDNCIILPNPDQKNSDGDNLGDACDPDPDGDGIIGEPGNPFETGKALVLRVCLACHSEGLVGAPEFGNEEAWKQRVEAAGGIEPLLQSVTFGKGEMPALGREYTARELTQAVLYLTGLEDPALGENLVDRDLDGVDDLNDNCINHPNSDQQDSNGNGTGDVCEPDTNGDGVLDYSLSFVIFQETPTGRVTGGIVDAAAGPVTVLARTRAGIEGLNYDWSESDPAILNLLNGTSGDVVTFTPTAANAGVYNLVVSVQGSGITGKTRARLVIVDSPVSDDLSDNDYDGYPGSIDNDNSNANRVLTNNFNLNGSSVFYSDQSITLGEFTALKAADTRYQSALATLSEADFLNAANSQYPDVTAVADPSISNSIGVMDFELRDLDTARANVRLNLRGNIPLGAGLKIYDPREGTWSKFVENGSDGLSSAPQVNGDCPADNSPNYGPGLVAGQACVRFQLTDGGVNDADGKRDGVISMLGAIGTLANDQGGGGGGDVDLSPEKGGGGSIGWWILLLLPIFYRRAFKS
ncbi:MAG: thrombospondin type 3 repeat-containing protein, partial [Granulosicoccus sp.]|nr:thrombospondin type 3 repeat-containing protein [Granulosicoccus sp.]